MLRMLKYYFGFGYQPKCYDEVKIISGFYRGHTGTVVDEAFIGPDIWVRFKSGHELLVVPWSLELL